MLAAAFFRGYLLEKSVLFFLRRQLGAHATIGEAGGNPFSGLLLRGVRGKAGAWPVVSFEADDVSARYDLAALARGRVAFLDSLEVTVTGARVELDLTGAPAAGSVPGDEPATRILLPRLPRLTVRDSRLRIIGRGFALEVDGLQGAAARADASGGQQVEIRVDRLSLRHPALREGSISLAIAGRYAPRGLTIAAAQANGEPLVERAGLELGERRGDVDLRLALQLWQGSVELGMLRRAAGTEVRWDARGVDLQPQLLLVNPALGALRGLLSTSGAVTLDGGGLSTLAGSVSLDWKGALVAGRAVDHLALQGSAAAGTVAVERAEGRIGPNEIRVHQATLPAAPLLEGRWRALLAAASGAFTASLGDVPAFLVLWGVSAGDRAAAVPDHRLRLEGTLEKGELRLVRGDLAAGAGTATLASVTVRFPREDQGWGETAFSGRADLAIPDLSDVSALLPAPSLRGSLRGAISGSGTFARPEGRASLTGRRIVVAGRMLGDAALEARGTAGGVVVDSLRVEQGGNRFTAQDVHFTPATLAGPDRSAFFDSLSGAFTLSSRDLPALAALLGIPPAAAARAPAAHLLTAAGTARGRTIALSAGSFTTTGGSATLRAARVVLPGPGADWRRDTTFEGDLEVDFTDLGAVATAFRLPPLQGTLEARARFSGSPGAPRGSVAASGRGIVVRGHRAGDVTIKAAVQEQVLRIESLEAARGADRLHARGSYDLGTRTVLEGEAEIALADVAPYLAEFGRKDLPVSGRLHVGLRAAGPLPGTSLSVDAQFSGGRVGGVGDVRGAAQAHYEPGRLRIGAFALTGSGGLAMKGEGTIPVDFAADGILSAGPISLRATADIPALEELAFLVPPAYAPAGTLHADLRVAGSWKEPEARLEVRGERLQLPGGTRFAPPGPATLSGTLTWDKAEARAEAVRLESPALSASLSGTWSSPPPFPSLAAGSGGAGTGSLALRGTFSSPDIGWLREALPGLRRVSGSLAGEIAVDGPAGDPAFSGEVRIAAGALRYQDLPPVDSLAARAVVAGRRVSLKEFGGNLGGSPFTLAGTLDFSRSGDPVLDLRLQGTNALLYRDEGLRIRADSDLTLRGPVSALSLTGELALTKSLYQKDFTIAGLLAGRGTSEKRASPGLAGISFPEPPLRDMRFDVRLTSREPFEIRTTVVRGVARPDLRLTGTGLLPILRGPILVDAAQVLLPSGTLELQRGTMLYREGDPDRPALDFGGSMQARGYEITVQLGGTLESPEVILSSIPPLPREELLLFVLTGAPPGSASADGGSVAALASPMAVYLGRNVLGQFLGGTGGTGFPDRIELQIGRETTRSGSLTVDARLRLKRDPLGDGSTLYLTSEKDIYDQYNVGLKVLFRFK